VAAVSSSTAPALRRAPLPEGTVPVAVSLLIAGTATYAFFIVGRHALGGEDAFAPIVAMWFATFALAPGFFLPLEQEMGRALAHRRALDEGGKPVVRRLLALGGAIVGAVVLILVLASPLITSGYFNGNWWMMAALVVAFIAYAPAHLARGICSGNGRFRAYAVIIGSDGVLRIIACVALALVGVEAVGAYGFAVALTPLVPVTIVGLRGQLRTEPGPEAEWQEVSQNLGWLLIGTVCSAALLNAGPVTANVLSDPADAELVTRFGYGVLLARIPLFMFQAVQAALLPRLSRLAARGQFDEFRDGFRKLILLVAAVGVVGTVGALFLGPFAIELVYKSELSGVTLALLALSSSLYMAALATGQAVIALRGHAQVAVGWLLGVVTFVLGTWLSSTDLFRRIELGLVISSATAAAFLAIALHRRLADGSVPTEGSMLDALSDRPLEG
jgi:O-antigen/teichoic acid export membrane protein